ncbi:MAG: hypothetical protein ABF296_09395 [Oceanococcaceae bacterium]
MTHEVQITTTIDAIPTARRVRVHKYDDGTFLGQTTTDAQGLGAVPVPDASPVWVSSADDYGLPWAASTAYVLNDQVFPNEANGHYYTAEAGGTTDAVEPVWPTDGGTVVDGTVTWRDAGVMIAPEIAGPFVPTPV